MNITEAALIAAKLIDLLADVGYSLHSGDMETTEPTTDPMRLAWWWCWTDGNCDVEVGDNCGSEAGALTSAVEHWFENATINYDTNL